MKKNKKQKPHYVDNKKFLQAMIDWRETWPSEENIPPVTNYIGECFLKIATHLSYRPNFINYTYRDEMISEKSKNPFAYFTQIIYYAFLRRIQKEKKQTHVRNKMIEKSNYEAFTTMEGDDGSYSVAGFDPHIMLPDEDVYKPKKKETKPAKGLEKFMSTSEEEEMDSIALRGDER